MNKVQIIIIWSFLIIITIFTVISFIWTNYAPINRIPIKEKILSYLDNTSYVKVKEILL